MKELSIEEKAKAYDEAIKRANELNYVSDKDSLQRKTIEHIFPELAESEDEKIRKQIKAFIKSRGSQITQSKTDAWIAWLEKQGSEPNWCHHKVDLSGCSEEYRKAYYDGWNNCNMQHSQCKSESNDVVKCLINGMKFYYEDNTEATWGTEKFSMKVKDILSWLEEQGEQKAVECKEKKYSKCSVYNLSHSEELCKDCEFNPNKKEVDDELQGIEKEVAEDSVNAIDRKRIPIVLKGEIKAKFKNEFNTLWQTVGRIQFANVAKHIIERLCLHFAAWGVYNLKGYCSISSEEKYKMDIEVKEVELEKEVELWMQGKPKVNFEWGNVADAMRDCAKHFFKLGLKAQHDNWKVVDNTNLPQGDRTKIYCVFTKQQYILATVINNPQDEDLLQWKCTEFPFNRYDMCEGDKYMQIV